MRVGDVSPGQKSQPQCVGLLGRGLPQAVSLKSDTFPLAYSAPTPPSFSQGSRQPAPHTPPQGFLQHIHQVGVRPPGAQSPNEDVTHRPASKIQEIHTGSRTPSSTQLTPPASLHSSVGAPPNTHSGPRTVHASQQDCNRCAQVHRPTGPSLADIGPHHRPNTQPAFLSRSEERAWKLAAHPREPGSQGLLDPGQEGSAVSGELPLQLSHSHTHTLSLSLI